MGRLWIVVLCLSIFLSACGAPAATQIADGLPFMVTITDTPGRQLAPLVQNSPEVQASATLESTPTLAGSATPEFTPTPTGPTPTETLLPPLEIPTEKPSAPALLTWTGEPTYPGDSEAGRLFRVDYDPDLWAQTTDNFGQVVLAQRQIQYCTLTPWTGRGLPADLTVQHDFRSVGNIQYDVNTVAAGEVVKFVAYVGGDQRLLTGFQVSFQDQQAQCLQDAETILATLRSFAAQPTITPTFTPSP